MEYLVNILIVIGSLIILSMLWAIVGVRHLRFLKEGVDEHWELIDEKLRKRQALIPNMVETIRMFTKDEEELIKNLMKERMLAAKEYFPTAKKIEYEYDITQTINDFFNLANKYSDLNMDTNFLELRKEIDDVESILEQRTTTYNEMIRQYNKHLNSFILKPLGKIFGYHSANIFEVEK
jgi:LemA protein